MKNAVKVAAAAALASSVLLGSAAGGKAKECLVNGKVAPDLVVMSTGTNVEFSGKCGIGAPKIVGRVTIKNIGSKKAPIISAPLISVWDTDEPKLKDEDRTLNVLQPGESMTKSVKAGRFMLGRKLNGVRTLQIMVDRREKIAECDEENNTWPRRIRVTIRCP